MTVHTWTVTVARKPEEVFAYLADISRHSEWSPKPYSIEAMTDGPIHVGSKYRSTGWLPGKPHNVNEVEITRLESPTRLSFVAREAGGVFKHDFVLTPQDGGTRVDRTIDLPKPPGFQGVVFPLVFAVFVKGAIQKGQNMLKAKMEAGA